MSASPIADRVPTTGAIFQVAWPLCFKAMMLHGIVVIDAYLVSGLGEVALAAMGLAAAIGGLMLGILFAFSSATQIRIAQAFGSGRDVALKTGLYAGLFINLTAALAGVVFVFTFGSSVLNAFAHTPWIAEQAQHYLSVFLIVVFAESICQALSSFFNGCGKTKVTFFTYLIAVPINIVFSILFINGLFGFPELGVMGAALGSALGSTSRAVILVTALLRANGGFTHVKGWLHDTFAKSLKRHIKFSVPIAVTFISMTASSSLCALIYAKMSVNDFAAITVILPWVHVAGTFGMSWAQSTGIMMAQLLGKRTSSDDLDTFLGRAWRSAFVASAIVSLMYLFVGLASDWIYSDLEPETRAAIFSFLPILLILPFPKGSNAICGQTLRAGGDTVYVMNIFVGSQWLVKVPLTLLFVLYLELPVVWVFALVMFDEIVKFPVFHLRLYKGKWKHGERMA